MGYLGTACPEAFRLVSHSPIPCDVWQDLGAVGGWRTKGNRFVRFGQRWGSSSNGTFSVDLIVGSALDLHEYCIFRTTFTI